MLSDCISCTCLEEILNFEAKLVELMKLSHQAGLKSGTGSGLESAATIRLCSCSSHIARLRSCFVSRFVRFICGASSCFYSHDQKQRHASHRHPGEQ